MQCELNMDLRLTLKEKHTILDAGNEYRIALGRVASEITDELKSMNSPEEYFDDYLVNDLIKMLHKKGNMSDTYTYQRVLVAYYLLNNIINNLEEIIENDIKTESEGDKAK